MGLWNRLSGWLDLSGPGVYRCVTCDSRFVHAHDACPECGGDVETDETVLYYYLDPI